MQCIYIGASNRNYGLQQYTIYTTKPEGLIETLKEKFPLIEKLFVTIEEFAKTDEELKKPETLIYKAYLQTKGAE